MPETRPTTTQLVVVPAIVTLLITALRLVGELQHWNERFFNRAALRAAAQQLRRHRLTSVRELSVEATIHETTRKAGWFTPVFTPRKALPEYLVLIDRFNPSDHQSLLDDEMINQLSDYDVILNRYYFSGDPRNELTAAYPDGADNLEPAWIRGAVHTQPVPRPREVYRRTSSRPT